MAAQDPRLNRPLTQVADADSVAPPRTDDSFDALVRAEYGFVWRVLRGMGLGRDDAQDAAQQVFVIAARKLTHIDAERARSFLYGTALRVANNTRRGIRRQRITAAEADDAASPDSDAPDRKAERARARQLLAELLAQIPEKLRRVLILAEIEHLEAPQIAALENVPLGTVASRLRLGRARFRELLEASRHKNPFAEST
jgi:RNA polymerase sigma-70 factor (ECF subfamily)